MNPWQKRFGRVPTPVKGAQHYHKTPDFPTAKLEVYYNATWHEWPGWGGEELDKYEPMFNANIPLFDASKVGLSQELLMHVGMWSKCNVNLQQRVVNGKIATDFRMICNQCLKTQHFNYGDFAVTGMVKDLLDGIELFSKYHAHSNEPDMLLGKAVLPPAKPGPVSVPYKSVPYKSYFAGSGSSTLKVNPPDPPPKLAPEQAIELNLPFRHFRMD